MDQSELEANACNRCQARENACTIGLILILLLIVWESGANLVNQSQSVVKQNQSKRFQHLLKPL